MRGGEAGRRPEGDAPTSGLAAVEVGFLVMVVAGFLGPLTTAVAGAAGLALAFAVWRLSQRDWPARTVKLLRWSSALTAVAGSGFVVAAGFTVTGHDPTARGLSAFAGLAFWLGVHLYVLAMRAAAVRVGDGAPLEALTEAASRWLRVWKATLFMDVVLVAAVIVSGVALVVNSGRDSELLTVSFSFAPAALVGVGLVYRLVRAQQATRAWLDAGGLSPAAG